MKDKSVILVVDDQPENTELLEAHLVPQGYEVVKAASGEEALKTLSGNQIDLVLLDVKMPRMSGFEVLEKMRADKKTRLIPVVVVTVLKETEDRIKALEAGCDDFISKPFDRHELLVRVKSLLRIKSLHDEVEEACEYAEKIINTVREPLIALDQDLRVVTVSRSFYEFFKVKPEETVGQLIYDLGNKQWDIPRLRELLEKVLPENKPFDNYEVEYDFATIGRRTILLNARKNEQATGKKQIILLAMEDITERKQLETILKNSEEQYRCLFETADDGILLLDKSEMKIRHANPAIIAKLGYSNEELIGNDLKNTGFPDKIGNFQEILETLNKDGFACWKDVLVQNKAGQFIHTDIYMTNRASLFQCNIRDITERISLEAQLRHSQQLESIGTLAGGIAHDFNNILSSVIGYTELALDDVAKGTPLEDNLQEVYTAGKRARDLVKQILTFARQTEEEVKPIQVDIIVKEVLKFIRSLLPTSIEIKQNIESDSLIMGNAVQVHQIMMNLCTNAAYAMKDDIGVLEISLEDVQIDTGFSPHAVGLKVGDYIKLSISDTGNGISPSVIGHIFDPYFTTKDVGDGTGVGLSMVHGIVESYNGKITVDSELGKGTTFSIYLPVTEKRDVSHPYGQSVLPSGTERILFVDDELPIAKMSSHILEGLGYRVKFRTSSVGALELFKQKPNDFDLVITDMTMPNMPGDKLAAELMKIRPDIPVILCSGYSRKFSDQISVEIGIKAFANKPIVKADLAEIVRKVLEEAKGKTQQ